MTAQASTQKLCTHGATAMTSPSFSIDLDGDGTQESPRIYRTSFDSPDLACWESSLGACDPENPQTAIWADANSILITYPGKSKENILDEIIKELLFEFPDLKELPLAALKSQLKIEQLGLQDVYKVRAKWHSLPHLPRLSGLLLRAIPVLQTSLDKAIVQPNFIYFGTQSVAEKKPIEWDDSLHTALKTINAPKAWNKTTGKSDATVAVIDSAIDCNHPDLNDNLRTDLGWTFSGSSPCGTTVVHGSFCAGIIGAEGNNGVTEKAVGVNWKVSMIPIRFLDDQLCGSEADAVNAITHASDKADVISASWGGLEGGNALKEAIEKAPLFIAAAGNLAMDLDTEAFYPASYKLTNMIIVGGINIKGNVSGNHGAHSVHLSAPGENVRSTGVGIGSYEFMGGTSAATAFVAGACALLKAHDSSLTASQIRKRIITTAQPNGKLAGASCTAGVLDLNSLLNNDCPGNCNDYPKDCP